MRGQEGKLFSDISADTDEFQLQGGAYVIDAVATWGGGTVTLQRKGPDGAFMTAATAFTANGTSGGLVLPPGTYKFDVVTATAVYVGLVRVPGE